MEFKLNKIDTEVRQVINDAVKEGKVHTKKELQVNKDKQNSKDEKYNEDKENMKNSFRKRIIVKAFKYKKVEVEGFYEDEESFNNDKGVFLDIKR